MLRYEFRPSDLEKDSLPWWVNDMMRRQLITGRLKNKTTIVSADGKGRVELREDRVIVVDRTDGHRFSLGIAPRRKPQKVSTEEDATKPVSEPAPNAPASADEPMPARIVRPPGNFWVTVLSFVYSQKTYSHVFAPHIADMRKEHADALQQGRFAKARWIAIRDNTTVVTMIIAHLPRWLVKLISRAWVPPMA